MKPSTFSAKQVSLILDISISHTKRLGEKGLYGAIKNSRGHWTFDKKLVKQAAIERYVPEKDDYSPYDVAAKQLGITRDAMGSRFRRNKDIGIKHNGKIFISNSYIDSEKAKQKELKPSIHEYQDIRDMIVQLEKNQEEQKQIVRTLNEKLGALIGNL